MKRKWVEDRYVNMTHLVNYLRAVRANRALNTSPHMDNALLNVQEMIERDAINPILWDSIMIGGCGSCKWSGKHQKCRCCRRNRYIKDCWEEKDNG